MTAVREWFASHVEGAPAVLAARAGEFLSRAAGATPGARCAAAGGLALHAAEGRGVGREAALDLLAADALITLALLDLAMHRPEALGEEAARLRRAAATG